MNIIFEEKVTDSIIEKYMLLELDSFSPKEGEVKKCWGLLGKDDVNIQEVHNMNQYVDLHNNMMKNYGLKNWKYCHDALDHLVGKFRGEFDSFYKIMRERIEQLEKIDLPETWSPVIIIDKGDANEVAYGPSDHNNKQ